MNTAENPSSTPARRPKKSLKRLKAGQKEEILEHCGNMAPKDARDWIKLKFGIETTESNLGAWFGREQTLRSIGARLDQIRATRDGVKLMSEAFGWATDLTEASILMLAQAAFEELLKEPEKRDPQVVSRYMSLALRARELGLKGSAHELAREKHYYDLARRSLAYAAELKSINDSYDDERDKIERAMVVLFGVRPDNTKFEEQTESGLRIPRLVDEEASPAMAGNGEEEES